MKVTTSRKAQEPEPLPSAWAVGLVIGAVAAALTLLGYYGHWIFIWVTLIGGAFLCLMLIVAGLMRWYGGDRQGGLTMLVLPGVLLVAPVIVTFQKWSEEHDEFHRLADVIRNVQTASKDCKGVENNAEVAVLASRIRGLAFEPARVVWSAYSTRRNEIYDCATKRTITR